jgi:hypothetical protein
MLSAILSHKCISRTHRGAFAARMQRAEWGKSGDVDGLMPSPVQHCPATVSPGQLACGKSDTPPVWMLEPPSRKKGLGVITLHDQPATGGFIFYNNNPFRDGSLWESFLIGLSRFPKQSL